MHCQTNQKSRKIYMMADDDQALEDKIEGMVEKAMSKHLQPLLEQAISAARSSETTTGGGKRSS